MKTLRTIRHTVICIFALLTLCSCLKSQEHIYTEDGKKLLYAARIFYSSDAERPINLFNALSDEYFIQLIDYPSSNNLMIDLASRKRRLSPGK